MFEGQLPVLHNSTRQHRMEQVVAKGMKRPRIVIIGAGMSGVSTAHHLLKSTKAASRFDLTVLEASQRVGGRICSAEIGGVRVELGATWIHGIEGSPVYKIAEEIGALDSEQPWEGKDGMNMDTAVRLEGGLNLDLSVVKPVTDLYRSLLLMAQEVGENAAKEDVGIAVGINSHNIKNDCKNQVNSVGAFLREGLAKSFVFQETDLEHERTIELSTVPIAVAKDGNHEGDMQKWDLRAIQKGVFKMHENLERSITGAGSLDDLNLNAYSEYKEFPGGNLPIAKGYSSIVQALASKLPNGMIQFGKKVVRVKWSCDGLEDSKFSEAPVQVHCEDGSIIEADHVVVTVSLGVLKLEAERVRRSAAGDSILGQTLEKDAPSGVAEALCTAALFDPPLPSWKLDCIARLGFGVVDKVFVEFEAPKETLQPVRFVFDDTAALDATDSPDAVPHWAQKLFAVYPTHKMSCVLESWYTGQEALEVEAASDDEVARGIVNTLRRFGVNTPAVRRIRRSKWGTDPLFQGSYSYVAIDASGDDIDTNAKSLPLQEEGSVYKDSSIPPLQLLFAGEATDRYYYGTTHAAYLSGLREAERLLQHYGYLELP